VTPAELCPRSAGVERWSSYPSVTSEKHGVCFTSAVVENADGLGKHCGLQERDTHTHTMVEELRKKKHLMFSECCTFKKTMTIK